jgi:hypothetical protein
MDTNTDNEPGQGPQPASKDTHVRISHTQPPKPPETGTPIDGPFSLSTILNTLLKKPLDLIATVHHRQRLPWLPLLLISILCLSVFGLVVGAFSGGQQFWAAPLKIVLGLGFGALICLPSLYIFCCLSGIDVSFQTVMGILISSIALLALLLVGFAPVVWLFSTSSSSTAFFGFLCIALWLICLSFGFKLINRSARFLGVKSTSHLKAWMAIFTLVTLQLPTTLRPIISSSDQLFNFEDKKFFLTHWLEQPEATQKKSEGTSYR